MNNNDRLKNLKKLFLIYLSVSVLAIHSYDAKIKETPQYEILKNNEAFASYSKGLIYIGNKQYLNNLKNVNEYDILVEDLRNNKNNPDMKIHSSYRILDKKTRNEVLQILSIYEETYPSDWNRTIDSMKLEWFCHNLGYLFDIKRDHTTDVDLDNNDEKKYDYKKLVKLLDL